MIKDSQTSYKLGFLILVTITILVSAYLALVIERSNSLLEWPLEGMLIETVTILSILTILARKLFHSAVSMVLLVAIIQIFLIGIIPVLRYCNELYMVSPYDSVAHYSFAKWIIEKGHVDRDGVLYYSQTEQYKFHPGNGILPATLSILTTLDLGISMNVMWFTSYLSYVLALIATSKYLSRPNLRGLSNVNVAIFIIAIIMLLVRVSPTYGGSELGYAYLGPLLYLIMVTMITSIAHDINGNKSFKGHYVATILVFLGLLVTHFATATIALFYLIFLTIALVPFIVSMKVIRGYIMDISLGRSLQTVMLLTISLLTLYVLYEIYIDIALFGAPLQLILKTLRSLYFVEMVEIEARMARGLTIEDFLLYVISRETKTLVIFGTAITYTVVLLLASNTDRPRHVIEKLVALYLFTSYPLLILIWTAQGSLIAGARIIPVLSFVLVLNIVVLFKKFFTTNGSTGVLAVILYMFMIIGFISNFGLPMTSQIRLDDETYKPPTFNAFEDYALHPVIFLSTYMSSSGPSFLCLHPYTAFGLCDLMWNATKIPRVGFIAPTVNTFEAIIQAIKAYLGKEVTVPLPTRDRIISAPLDAVSFYMMPKHFMLNMCEGLLYNNLLYMLFKC